MEHLSTAVLWIASPASFYSNVKRAKFATQNF